MATSEDFGQIAGSALMIGHCAEDLAQGLDTLEKTVGSEHPWGGDQPGSTFGAVYTDVLSHALETLDTHVGQLVTAAERLATWAAQSTQAQLAGSETLFKVGRKLER